MVKLLINLILIGLEYWKVYIEYGSLVETVVKVPRGIELRLFELVTCFCLHSASRRKFPRRNSIAVDVPSFSGVCGTANQDGGW